MTLEMNEHKELVDKRVNELSRIFEPLMPEVIINWGVRFEPVFLIHSDSLYPERYNIVIQAQLNGMWIDHTPKKLTTEDLRNIGQQLLCEPFRVSYAIELNASAFTYRRAVESIIGSINAHIMRAFEANKRWPFDTEE